MKPFCLLAFLYLLGISAILRANVAYIDDMGRIAQGYHEWDTFNRYLSTFFSNLIHMDWYLTDVSPLPQLLAAMILAAAGVIMIHAVSGSTEISFWSLIAALPLGLSPYFLECFSYRYDAPYMALSIFFSLLPALWARRGGLPWALAAAAGALGMCCTYQAAAGIFPMLVLQLWLLRRVRQEGSLTERLHFVLYAAAGYLAGLLVFRLVFMHPTDPGLYAVTEVPPIGELLPSTVNNLRLYFALVLHDFRPEWQMMTGLTALCFIGVQAAHAKKNRLGAALLALAVTVLMLLLSFGVYPLLREPIFSPRAMYGLGMFFCCIGIPLSLEKLPAARAVPLFLSFAFFTFAFSYGNALRVQQDYTDFRIQAVVQDLQELEPIQAGTEPHLQLIGGIGYAPAIRSMPSNYDLLRRLVPVTFDGKWLWGKYTFFKYYDLRGVTWDAGDPDPEDLTLPILKDTMYHTIRGNSERILVQLK